MVRVLRTEEEGVQRSIWIAGLVVVVLLAVLPSTVSGAGMLTRRPHAGQRCNPHRRPPPGFDCFKNRLGKYRLVRDDVP